MAAEPMYRQIADDLRRKIEFGELLPGGRLPTEIELMEQYEASRNTVRDAIKLLTTRNLVETRPGQGTFVVEEIVPFVTTLTRSPDMASGSAGDTYIQEVTAEDRTPKASSPRVEIHNADVKLAAELQLEEGATLVSRHQQRFIDDTPWSLQTSFYPMSLAERGATRLLQASNIPDGTIRYMQSKIGVKEIGWRDLITVRAPDKTEAGFFSLPDDGSISVIELRRTAFDEQGTPVRVTVSVYPADRNQFAVNVGSVPPEVENPVSAVHASPRAVPSADGAPPRGS